MEARASSAAVFGVGTPGLDKQFQLLTSSPPVTPGPIISRLGCGSATILSASRSRQIP